MDNNQKIPVVINGAAGKMGREVIKAVSECEDMIIVGAVDRNPAILGQDAGEIAGCGAIEIPILNDLQSVLVLATQEKIQGVMVDFTHPDSTTQIEELGEFADKASTGALIIPNFSIGMVLLQQAALQAAQYFDHVEIIELHHNQKADAPSGTAIKTAQMLTESGKIYNSPLVKETETITGARGGKLAEIPIHSIRLPGLIAHQEVIFGAPGQIYTLRHDTSDRSCYMPGVLLAIRKVTELKSLVYGLEKLL